MNAQVAAVTSQQRALRVAFLWNGAVQAEENLDRPRPVVLGTSAAAMFPLPELDGQRTPDLTLLTPQGHGYALQVTPDLGGAVWMGGERRDVRTLAGVVALGPEDYGVVTVGTVAFFFQHVRAAKSPPKPLIAWDWAQFSAIMLSIFLHASLFFVMLRAHDEAPQTDPLELPSDLIRRFMVTPPPEDIIEQNAGGTDVEDPGLSSPDEAGGERAEGEEGTVGNEDATQDNTELAGPATGAVAQRVQQQSQLLQALNSSNAIAGVLDNVPDVNAMLGGLGGVRNVAGRGSGGFGLRGSGGGGGGTGPGGVLFGAGNMGTGAGAGPGSGLGRGNGGIGVKGRPRAEVAVTLQQASARTNGYLSAEQINRVVRANAAAIRYCYEVEVQRQQNLRGRIEVEWRINLQGSVTTARVQSSTMGNPRVEGCIVRQVRRWRFDQPDGGEVVVSYPFIFGVQGG